MDASVMVGVVLAVVAVISLWVAYHQYKLSHSDHINAAMKESIQQAVASAQEPLKDTLTACVAQITQQGEDLKANSSDLKNLNQTVAQMGVKVDMYWNSMLRRNSDH